MNNIKKSISIYKSLSTSQQKKLEKDFTLYSKSLQPKIDIINRMVESGFYTGSKRSWLLKMRSKYSNKSSFSNYVLQKGFAYSNL